MSKLLPNLPIENLTEENDYLGIIEKADLIKTFLESNTAEFEQIKMFALYGEWGSGKSTLMKYLEKELKGTFNTFFFEAWEFEADRNLSASLLEYLISDSKGEISKAFEKLKNTTAKLFEGLAKATTIKAPIFNFSGKEFVTTMEKEDERSFLQLKNDFKKEFIGWEREIIKRKSTKYNIVFIDDLDRCEPENVLNLLSALKLFFTYGKKTIFFCGIDKKAVKEAVKTKYGDVVKANEYIEKIFDISYTMPEHEDLTKLIAIYFDDGLTKEINSVKYNVNKTIEIFFVSINLTNPRRVKKVLNKFLMLRVFRENLDPSQKESFPNIAEGESGGLLEIIITLYAIAIHEFSPEIVGKLNDFENKSKNYMSAIYNVAGKDRTNDSTVNTDRAFLSDWMVRIRKNETLQEFRNKIHRVSSAQYKMNHKNLVKLFFAPYFVDEFTYQSLSSMDNFKKGFRAKNKSIDYYFLEFLINNEYLFEEATYSDFKIGDLRKMMKKFL